MEAKIQKLKSYLKDPKKAIEDDFSLLVALQEILDIREHEPTNTQHNHDREIYELFHATMSLFIQPIENSRLSRWNQIRPAFVPPIPKDEIIVGFEGFDNETKHPHELRQDFQSHLRIDKASIEHLRKNGVNRTTLQKICDSYIMISFPYNHRIGYDNYISSIDTTTSSKELTSQPQSQLSKQAADIDFNKLKEYIAFSLKRETENGDKSKFEVLCEDMRIRCGGYKGKQYAALALLLYESKYLNNNKGRTFSGWLKTFCEICGQKPPKYKKNQLQTEKMEVSKAFYYLLP